VSEWMLVFVKKDGGLVFHNLNGCIRTINNNKNCNLWSIMTIMVMIIN
jgi:hypothetical protein